MCGIAGFYSHSISVDPAAVLEAMIGVIHHRGPDSDDVNVFRDRRSGVVGLGHKRLSIIDLSENGRQPMTSVSGRSTIVFNGEIYNYKELRRELEQDGWTFRTHTDTEVILNLYEKYGTDCLARMNGMFAFAIYDHEKEQLFLVRDRLGIRPLFYAESPGHYLVFGSEIKALFPYPGVQKTVNHGALWDYALNRYVNYPETVYEGVAKLEPGHYLLYKDGNLTKHAYWDIERFDKSGMSLEEAEQEFDRLIRDSIRLRMISDVPVGAFLSGGLDSSLIVALMAEQTSRPVKTFSVGLENSQYSELGYARVIADLFRTEHEELVLTPGGFRDHIEKAIHFRDAPASETADVPMYMLSLQAKKKVSVVLTGEGSDELFAGYPKYAYDQLRNHPLLGWMFRSSFLNGMVQKLPYSFRKVKLAYRALSIEEEERRFRQWFASFSEEKAEAFFSRTYKEQHLAGRHSAGHLIKGTTTLDRMQYYDTKYWLSDNLLERGDRMMMAGSIEGRVPFLDYRLAELAFRLPEHHKIRGMNRKYIVKKTAARYIPESIINRKKVGFYIPVGDWFKNELKDYLTDVLLSDSFRSRGLFQADRVEDMVRHHIQGSVNYEKELWMLLNLELWLRTV